MADMHPAGATLHSGMIRIPGGTFRMGSDHHYSEEKPAHTVTVDGFWMDPTPVTNAQFTNAFAAALHRPALVPLPLPALRVMFGSEMVDEALLSGTRVQPRRLLDDGFEFEYPRLPAALADVA